MSETVHLPEIVRPVIVDDTIREYQARLEKLGLVATQTPCLHLFGIGEIHAMPLDAKSDALDAMTALAENLEEEPTMLVEVTAAELFTRKRGSFVGLHLAAGSMLERERRAVIDILDTSDVDVSKPPFNSARYRVEIAGIRGVLSKTAKYGIKQVTAGAYPGEVTLGSPRSRQ